MSPTGRRYFDLAIIALAGICLGAVLLWYNDAAVGVICARWGWCEPEPHAAIIERLALVILAWIVLYALLVRAPLHVKQWRLRTRLSQQCRHFRQTCIDSLILAAGGPAEPALGHALTDATRFRNYFETEVSPGQTRWQAMQINLDPTRRATIVASLETLHDDITLVLNSIEIPCYAPFEIRKRLAAIISAINSAAQPAEQTRLLANMLWDIFAARDAVLNIAQDDLLTKTLACMDWDLAVPFTRSWWRKTERREPISAYETLW